jgi:serine/threonine protein kinase
MATVYLARDLKHDRSVALKVLHPELAATLGPARFLQEIQVTARLQQPPYPAADRLRRGKWSGLLPDALCGGRVAATGCGEKSSYPWKTHSGSRVRSRAMIYRHPEAPLIYAPLLGFVVDVSGGVLLLRRF